MTKPKNIFQYAHTFLVNAHKCSKSKIHILKHYKYSLAMVFYPLLFVAKKTNIKNNEQTLAIINSTD